jgi:hypothetical protein
MGVRAGDTNPASYEHVEWIAAALMRLHPARAFDRESFVAELAQRIRNNEADLRDLEAMRK